jgi:hypothetical protein
MEGRATVAGMLPALRKPESPDHAATVQNTALGEHLHAIHRQRRRVHNACSTTLSVEAQPDVFAGCRA